MSKILSGSHIVPSMSNGYNASDIFQVVKDAVGTTPTIGCENDKVNRSFLFDYGL